MPNWKKVIVSGSDAILSDVTIDNWGSVSASLASIEAGATSTTLQEVTNNGQTTSRDIILTNTSASFRNSSGNLSNLEHNKLGFTLDSAGTINSQVAFGTLNSLTSSFYLNHNQPVGGVLHPYGSFDLNVEPSTVVPSSYSSASFEALQIDHIQTQLGHNQVVSLFAYDRGITNATSSGISIYGPDAIFNQKKLVLTNITEISSSGEADAFDVIIKDWGSVSASLASIESGATSTTLQEVTDNGNTTTNDITVAGDIQIHKGPNAPQLSIAIGSGSLQNDSSFGGNIAIGVQALKDNTTGTNNIAIGWRALSGSLTGNANIAIGDTTLLYNTTGTENTAIGDGAMRFNMTGDDNTSLGRNSLGLTSGDGNVALGYNAHYGGTNSNYNTSIGFSALYGGANTGGHSVAIGAHSAGDIPNNVGYTKPTDGVYIGAYTIGSAEYTTNEIVIGAYVTGSGNNTVTIGNSNITNNYFSGDIDADDITIDGWGSVSASLASLEASSAPTLQQVTDNGSTTTNSITISGSSADLTLTGGSGSIETDHTTTFSSKKTIPNNNIVTIFSVSQETYVGGVVEYTFFDNDRSNMRSGIVTMVANSTATRHSELVTTDIGSTDNLEIQVVLTDSGFGMRVNNNTGSSFTAVCNVKVLKE